GTCSLTANWAADNNYTSATASQSTGATKIAASVTFTGAPASAAYQSSFTVAATTNASTTAVIAASGACTIAGNTVTITSTSGVCSLSANWSADSNYLAASSTQSTAVGKATPTVTFTGAPASAAYQSTFSVASTTNASVTPVIAASGACTIAGNTVTMTSATGMCSLTANWAADNNYTSATASQSTAAAKAGSATAIASNTPNPSTLQQAVTVTFSVTGSASPTGTVTVNASTGGSCNGSLSAGAGSCSLTFSAAGSRTLTASYSGDANFTGSTSAAVTQSVNAPTASLSSSNLNFPKQKVGTTSSQKKVTLSNTGAGTLNIASIAITGASSGDFAQTNNCGPSLQAGASCTLSVTFTPKATGARTAALSITDNASGSPQQVSLKGSGS
ncbi:MAG: hypothetical protein DMG27_19240, partial [Acidobacteria bacterium]